MEDADDESGQVLHETKISAVAPDPPSPREKANSKKSRHSPSSATQTDSDSTTILSPRSRREKESRSKGKDRDRTSERDRKDRDREEKHKRTSSRPTTVTFSKPERPSAKQTKTSPVLHHSSRKSQESEYYGVAVSQPQQRDRSYTHHGGRSLSYHGQGYHPPQSNAQFYMSQTGAMAPQYSHQQPYGSPFGTSYPSPAGGPVPPLEYFEQMHQKTLKQRFETGPRSASAMGHRPPSKSIYERDHEEVEGLRRRPSLKKRDTDRERMPPPPPRPKTTKPEKMVLRPPQVHRTRGYDEDDFGGDLAMYQHDPRRTSGDYSALFPAPPPRRPSVLYVDNASGYGLHPAVSHRPRSRPHSFYGQLDYEYGPVPNSNPGYPGADKYEDNMRLAEQYQTQAVGSSQPLTKDALQKASKRSHGGSSRSTRSTESRDESDYRHSNTTRTTRSISGEDDLTIKVPANAVIEVQGAKIQCRDGGEVNITTGRPGGGGGSRSGGSSDKESTVYEERPTRAERPQFRGRTMSQSSSFSRTLMDPYYAPHYYPQNYI